MKPLPTGTITFLFTDIEGSTKLWEAHPERMREALRLHDEMLNSAFTAHGGVVVKHKGEGDSFFAVFQASSDAVRAACSVLRQLAAAEWPTPEPIHVRMALHTGEAELRDGDYYGTVVNRCARLRAIAHGGQAILSAATAQLAAGGLPAELTLRDLGPHRLKDLATPEQVFQIIHPALPDGFPPLRSLPARMHNLPVQSTPFIGREAQLKELRARLRDTRLLSLLGPGGAGKTRLSLQLAAESADDFADGVWLVELAPLHDAGLLVQTVASVLGIRERQRLPLQDTLAEELHTKRLLLLLDNCEHLIEPCAQLAASLMQRCPGVKLVATSREPLNVTGETIWRIPPLSLPRPEERQSPERMLAYEAVRLFVDRASSMQRTFQLTAQNIPAVMDICQRLDGIPLALELAAARVKSLSVEQIAQRLGESFRLLTGGDRTRLARQQTLRALVDWSHDLLGDEERIMWRRLAVFAGSFPLEAAEAVCAGDGIDEFDVLDLLGLLVDKSLVVSEEKDGAVRYRLLETIRQYGLEKLKEAGERDLVFAKHCDYYLTFLERTSAGMRSPHMQPATAKDWARELDNLRVAMDWSAQSAAGDPVMTDKTGRLLSSSTIFWQMLGLVREGYERIKAYLALPGSPEHPATRVSALLVASSLCADTERENAVRYIAESLELARKLGDAPATAKALAYTGIALSLSEQFSRSIAFFDEAYEILQGLSSEWEMTNLLRFKAVALMNQTDYAAARSVSEQNIQLCRRLGNLHEEAASLRIIGIVESSEGNAAAAKKLFHKSLEITTELGDKQCTLHGLGAISLVAEGCGENELAAWLAGAYERLSESVGLGLISSFISPEAMPTWEALKAGFPEPWSSGRQASFNEAVDRARAFVSS